MPEQAQRKYKAIYVSENTHDTLKKLALLYQEPMTILLERLAQEELQRAKDRGSVTNYPA